MNDKGPTKSFYSKLRHNKGIHLLFDIIPLPQNNFLKILIGLIPLFHQYLILIELPNQTLYQFMLSRKLLEQHVLGETVHHGSFLHVFIDMIDDHIEGITVSIYDCYCALVGEGEAFLHLGTHVVQLVYCLLYY